MTVAFEQASYLAQVLRLRAMAKLALAEYSLRVEDCRFLSHGENATFRVTANGGKRFLLRIHRNGYHTHSAILEELHWLQELSRDPILIVPRPIPSKRGRLLESVQTRAVGASRSCSVLEWIEGRFINKSVNRSHLNGVGKLLGRLHRLGQKRQVVERRYWDAEGLLGANAKWGSLDDLPVSSSAQKIISDGRRFILRNLKRLETRFPQKQGLIHADLHFGNLLLSQKSIAAIDFDDCGYGFYAYDLVMPLRSAEHILGKRQKRKLASFKAALIEGYSHESDWDDDHDEEILSHLMTARRLVLLGWLNSRSDNPDLRRHFKTVAGKVVRHLQTIV